MSVAASDDAPAPFAAAFIAPTPFAAADFPLAELEEVMEDVGDDPPPSPSVEELLEDALAPEGDWNRQLRNQNHCVTSTHQPWHFGTTISSERRIARHLGRVIT